MDLRQVTGWIALALLAAYWSGIFLRTAPELRKGTRGRRLRLRILLVKTAALALTGLFVAVVHFWASQWWQVAAAVPVALAGAVALRRAYRRLVAVPRHRVALAQRVRGTGHFQIIREPGAPEPHRHAVAADDGAVPGTVPFVVPGAAAGAAPADQSGLPDGPVGGVVDGPGEGGNGQRTPPAP